MRYIKGGVVYTAIAIHGFSLATFSEHGSIHELAHNGRPVQCFFEFSGGAPDTEGKASRYGGPIVVYMSDVPEYFITPNYEFFDGRFVPVEEVIT